MATPLLAHAEIAAFSQISPERPCQSDIPLDGRSANGQGIVLDRAAEASLHMQHP